MNVAAFPTPPQITLDALNLVNVQDIKIVLGLILKQNLRKILEGCSCFMSKRLLFDFGYKHARLQ